MAPIAVPGDEGGDRRSRAERSRTEILDVATAQFAGRGYAGVRVDEIAAATSTTKRMIYYYFGGKEQLYDAVLERAFQAVRPDPLHPALECTGLDKIRFIARRTYDRHHAHPEFARLLIIENLLQGRNVERCDVLKGLGQAGFDALDAALAEGVEQGLVRAGVDAWDLSLMIHAFCTFRIANRHTFRLFSGRDLQDEALTARHRTMLDELVLGYLRAE